jgi:predicted deacylase
MEQRITPLLSVANGTRRELGSLHFGTPGRGPKVYIQASLHADELPGMLVAHHLRQRLVALEQRGEILGEIVLVPVANPIGLAQTILGDIHGRFDLRTGQNFNRRYPALTEAVAARCEGKLGADGTANVALIRAALREEMATRRPADELESLRLALFTLAYDADIVLDLHCDYEAVLHMYVGTPLWPALEPLAALLGARAVLLATDSGDDPFDEACSRIWWELAERFGPSRPVPLACLATTIELRGYDSVNHAYAAQDARAIERFLRRRGVLAGGDEALPAALCSATPLAGSMPIVAPQAGLLAFVAPVGAEVSAGEHIADLIDPFTGATTRLCSEVAGVLYARENRRYVTANTRVAKVAGAEALRSGNLLSA